MKTIIALLATSALTSATGWCGPRGSNLVDGNYNSVVKGRSNVIDGD